MGATIVIKEANGAGPAWTQADSFKLCAADLHDPGLDYPISIPQTGFRYSYWKTLCMEISGTFSEVSNIRFYTDGAIGYTFGSGGFLLVGTKDTGDSGLAIGDYDQATGEEGISGDYMDDAVDGHAIYKQAGYSIADAKQYVVSSPLLLDSTEYTEPGKTKAVVLQAKVDTAANGAEAGDQAAEPISLMFDEI